jgi:arginyl-tRNA synthetase
MFKPFHIGHTVGITFGESLTRIFEASGAKTIAMSYPSDVSLGIAKAVWSLVDEKKTESFSIDDMGLAYVRGTQKYEESESIKADVIRINKNIYAGVEDIYFLTYQKGIQQNLLYFKNISKRLGTDFEHFIFESESGRVGLSIVQENIGKVFEESENAVIYDGQSKGLHTRVFINSEGLPTYESKDIGLLDLKFNKFTFDKSFVYTDMEQQKYFEVLKMAAGEINPEWAEKSEYLQYGRLNFSGGKISSRYGNVPLAEDLLDSVKENIKKIIDEKDFSEDQKEDISEKLSIGALKYSFLKVTMGKKMMFDFENSLDFSGNSGPYLQYAYVRAQSILRKNESKETKIEEKKSDIVDLEKILYRFPESIDKSLSSYSPHHIANYVYDLASEFNSFYGQEKISDIDNPDYQYNLMLVESFAQTMKNGLHLLGIETVEKM